MCNVYLQVEGTVNAHAIRRAASVMCTCTGTSYIQYIAYICMQGTEFSEEYVVDYLVHPTSCGDQGI